MLRINVLAPNRRECKREGSHSEQGRENKTLLQARLNAEGYSSGGKSDTCVVSWSCPVLYPREPAEAASLT
jgi:hypothetical protein